ncbi:MAG: acetyl-CoA carboxylase biotin carboxylase subunit, partial [Deltaproteobacteria bacterium]|nr:acetyl-CoA carboxylase biotin carboxylase subunit [Deltaproteobacteria bacterium]
MFKRILIANRGEIAVRVIRACRELGIESVAIFSEADRASLHVREADFAVNVGPPPAAESYLNTAHIIEAASRTGAEAIHPGYGFFSENPSFARAVEAAGITFIGPPPSAIEQMGDKVEARRLMTRAGVPVVPGSPETLQGEEEVRAVAKRIGYPIMLKAAAGGGGKGMRLVENDLDLASLVRTVSNEAKSSFGDGRFYVEKFISRPRHIEVQVFADQRGNTVHLFERECSLQRRHQKVVEESPSPFVTPAMRSAMGEVAVKAARAVNYVGAGTIEFLADADHNFYFLEMNTRIQVEHPVTELVTGIDLVKLQIRVAAGEPLPFAQDELRQRGWALECRVYAEDPAAGFAPAPGKIQTMRLPDGPGIRIDAGVYEGAEVPIFYDPMICKLIAWGHDRDEAIARMR